mgnify:CR=1 FL=1
MSSPLTNLETDLLDFVARWAPYGGPRDEDTMPHFGLTASQVVARCSELISHGCMREIRWRRHRSKMADASPQLHGDVCGLCQHRPSLFTCPGSTLYGIPRPSGKT